MHLCIVGTGRCGTTLLWQMLNAHPGLFVFRETHWLPALWESFGTAEADTEAMMDIVARTRFVDGTAVTPLAPDSLRARPDYSGRMTVRAFTELLGKSHAEAVGKRLWADKTPDYGYFMAPLQVLWPELRFVHVLRDGMDVAKSMAGHPGYRALVHHKQRHWPALALDYAPPETLPRPGWQPMASLWHDRLMRIEDEAGRLAKGSIMTLRYEDLRADPRLELSRLARFADLEADQDWLEASAAMVNPARGHRAHSPEEYADLPVPARTLLGRLGYPVAAEAAS